MSRYDVTLDYAGAGSVVFPKAKLLAESAFTRSSLEVL